MMFRYYLKENMHIKVENSSIEFRKLNNFGRNKRSTKKNMKQERKQ